MSQRLFLRWALDKSNFMEGISRYYKKEGLTLLEIILVIGLVFIAASFTAANFSSLHKISILIDQTDLVLQALREAKELSRSGFQGYPYGVYFNVDPNTKILVTLYQGSSYAERSSGSDRIVELEEGIRIASTTLQRSAENSLEINFSAQQGLPDNYGTLVLSDSYGNSRMIEIGRKGTIY